SYESAISVDWKGSPLGSSLDDELNYTGNLTLTVTYITLSQHITSNPILLDVYAKDQDGYISGAPLAVLTTSDQPLEGQIGSNFASGYSVLFDNVPLLFPEGVEGTIYTIFVVPHGLDPNLPPPADFFSSESVTSWSSLTLPVIADALQEDLSFTIDTDAVAALLSMAVTRYIRPMLEFEDEIDFSQLFTGNTSQPAAAITAPTDTVSEQIAILNARIAILKASNNDLTNALKAAPDEQILSAETRKQMDMGKKQQERRVKQIEGEYYEYLKGTMDRYTDIARTLEKPAQDSEYRISNVIRSVINECKEEAASTKNIIMNLHVVTKSL
ncbi:MAG: hypothetical protein WCP33_05430, partial [Deltaproteobacteria bacterium]